MRWRGWWWRGSLTPNNKPIDLDRVSWVAAAHGGVPGAGGLERSPRGGAAVDGKRALHSERWRLGRKEIRQMKNKVNDMWTVVTMR